MSQKPRISFIIPADSHKKGERGKIDAQGIFTELGVYGLPASREFSIVIGLNEIPVGEYRLNLMLKSPSNKSKDIGEFNFKVEKYLPSIVHAERINISFDEIGKHQIIAQDKETNESRYINILVQKREWPKPLSGKELEEAYIKKKVKDIPIP